MEQLKSSFNLENVYQFWSSMELKLSCDVPKHIQHILAFNGFQNAVSIKTITSDDINVFEKFAREKMKDLIPPNSDLSDFYGSFAKYPENFIILPGYVRQLQQIVSFIKEKTVSEGPAFFAFKTKSIEIKKIPRQVVSGNGRSLLRSTSNVSNILNLTEKTSNASNIPNPTKNTTITSNIMNPTGSTSSTSNTLYPTSETNTLDETRSNYGLNQPAAQKVSGSDSTIVFDPILQEKRRNILSNVITWTKKKARGIYEQYSEKFCLDMVTFNYKTDLKADSSIDESQPKEMCAVIQCPVCESQLVTQTASKILSDGQQSDYFTGSGYYTHIKKVHLAATKEKNNSKSRKTKSSTSSNPRKKSKKNAEAIKHKPKRRSQSQSQEESEEFSSSDSEDDIDIEHEMNENFQINSDMDVDSDSDDSDENSSTQNCDVQQTTNIVSRSTTNDRPGEVHNTAAIDVKKLRARKKRKVLGVMQPEEKSSDRITRANKNKNLKNHKQKR